jgi:hypothetical protein
LGNLPKAAAATPSPQSSTEERKTADPAPTPVEGVADATAGAGDEVGKSVGTVAGAATQTTGTNLPRTSQMLSDASQASGKAVESGAEAAADILRRLPLGVQGQ